MKIQWNEPKWSFEPRWMGKVKSQLKSTSWARIAFWLFVFLPLSIMISQHFYPNKGFRSYYLPIVFAACGLFLAYYGFIIYKTDRPKITIDDKGIRLQGAEDNLLKKYYYDKITSIELLANAAGNYSLLWQYDGKTIIRGLSQEIDIAKLKAFIENNSYLELKIREP